MMWELKEFSICPLWSSVQNAWEDSAEFSNSGLADFHCSRAGRRHFQLSATTVKAAIDNAKETGTAVF